MWMNAEERKRAFDGHNSANQSGTRCHVCWLQAWTWSALIYIAFCNLQSTLAFIISFAFHQNCTTYVDGRGITYLHKVNKGLRNRGVWPMLELYTLQKEQWLESSIWPSRETYSPVVFMPISQVSSLSPRFSEGTLSSLARSLIRVPWK